MMAYHAVTIGNNFEPMQQELLDKHYLRKQVLMLIMVKKRNSI